jgi:hypothetical protein
MKLRRLFLVVAQNQPLPTPLLGSVIVDPCQDIQLLPTVHAAGHQASNQGPLWLSPRVVGCYVDDFRGLVQGGVRARRRVTLDTVLHPLNVQDSED